MSTAIHNLTRAASLSAPVVPWKAYAEAPGLPAETSALHLHLMWTCIGVGVLVFLIIFYSVIEFRRSHSVLKAPWHATTAREMMWTAIPFLMLVALVTPATRSLIALHDAQKDTLRIEVSAPPIIWHVHRPGPDNAQLAIPLATLAAAADGRREIVLPSHRPIRVRFEPGASWSIPEADFHPAGDSAAAEGSALYFSKSGVYEAQCTGTCGDAKGAPLLLRVRAVPQGVYDAWLRHIAEGGEPEPVGPHPGSRDARQ